MTVAEPGFPEATRNVLRSQKTTVESFFLQLELVCLQWGLFAYSPSRCSDANSHYKQKSFNCKQEGVVTKDCKQNAPTAKKLPRTVVSKEAQL